MNNTLNLALVSLVVVAGCSTDALLEFPDAGSDANANDVGTQSDGSVSDGSVSDGSVSDAPAVPISIVNATPIIIHNAVDPVRTLTPTPAAGNALIVGITCFSEVDNCIIPANGVTDNQGNTYVRVKEGASILNGSHGSRPYIFFAQSVGQATGAFTIRIDANGGPDAGNYQNFSWGVLEVAGLATTNAVDKTGDTPSTCCNTSTTVATPTATTQANELAVAVCALRGGDGDVNFGFAAGWTQHQVWVDAVSNATPHSLVSRILTAPGVVSHTWTHEQPNRGTASIIVTFKGRTP